MYHVHNITGKTTLYIKTGFTIIQNRRTKFTTQQQEN